MRDPIGLREMLEFMSQKYPMTMTNDVAAKAMDVSLSHLHKLIKQGKIKRLDGKIPLMSVCRYLCS